VRVFIGIDDTDNKESRGTGFLARRLASLITTQGMRTVAGITRHQLLVDDRIPYTSQNSSACLDVEADNIMRIYKICSSFLIENVAEGSDAGLCIAPCELITNEIMDFGNRAQNEVLTQAEAAAIARENRVILEGYTGDRGGIIGALAAVGLRKGGNDGRFIWLRGKEELRDIEPGIYEVQDILNNFDIDLLECEGVRQETGKSTIYLGDWVRPVLKDNKVCLIVEKASKKEDYDWKVAAKEFIRSIS
jgi:hypothetical protein